MAGDHFINRLLRPLARRKRTEALLQAAQWPIHSAKILSAKVVAKDPLADADSESHDSQVECPFYLTLGDNYLSGYLRSVPMTFSEANRAAAKIGEDTIISVRCNPQNPDDTHTLAEDNTHLPFAVWPS